MKRWLSLLLLSAMVLMALQTGMSPVAAAPSAVASNLANARLFPPDTALYLDLNTSDLANSIKAAQALAENLTGQKQDQAFASLDAQLTAILGHPATLEKDVLSWVGDHISIGLRIPDTVMTMSQTELEKYAQSLTQPQIIIVVDVKDKKASDAFWDAALKAIEKSVKLDTSTVDADGTTFNVVTGAIPLIPATVGTSGPPQKYSLARGDKYLALGDADSISLMLDNLKNKKPAMADDAKFTKVTNALKDEALGAMYVAPRIYYLAFLGLVITQSQLVTMQSSLTATGTPEPAATPAGVSPDKQLAQVKAALGTIEGQALSIRRDGKSWILDTVSSVDIEALKKLYPTLSNAAALFAPKPIGGKLSGQVPDTSAVFVSSSGLNNVYDVVKMALDTSAAMNPTAETQQAKKQFEQVEAALTLAFDLNLRDDVLGWMDGEFAVYANYNPKSVLANVSPNSKFPFDVTILVQTSQPDKAKTFLTKLNAGITKFNKGNTKITSLGNDMYSLKTGDGIEIDFGLIDKTFIITTASGLDKARAALKGDGVLSASTIWKSAQKNSLDLPNAMWFANMDPILTAAQALMPATASDSDKRALAFLKMIESVSGTSSMPQPGMSVARIQVTLK